MGRLELKLMALLILLTGLPLAVALWQAGSLFERSLGAGLNPLVAEALDDAVTMYGDYVKAEKQRFRTLGASLAGSRDLATAVSDPARLDGWLQGQLRRPGVFAIEVIRDGAPPTRVAEDPPPTPDRWLTRTEDFPVARLPGVAAVRLTYGTPAELLDRFHRMERDVIHPFRVLEADRQNVATIYAWSFVGYLGAAIFLAALVSVLTARRVTRRLRDLRDGMAAVAAGDLTVRVPPTGRDEVADLAQNFNDMTERLTASQARVQYLTQVSAWQGIARKLAHEIKNPLTPILLAVQQVHEGYRGDDDRHAKVLETAREIVEQEVQVLQRLVENFSRFARLPEVTPAAGDLVGFARDVAAANAHLPGLTVDAPDQPVSVALDRDLLRQAVTNLVNNAAEACRDQAIEPKLRIAVAATAGGGELIVEDNGPGVPEADRARIFDPYVTGKHDGTGLGLAIVKKIILDHGGSIAVHESPLGGARFVVWLPTPDPGGAPT